MGGDSSSRNGNSASACRLRRIQYINIEFLFGEAYKNKKCLFISIQGENRLTKTPLYKIYRQSQVQALANTSVCNVRVGIGLEWGEGCLAGEGWVG